MTMLARFDEVANGHADAIAIGDERHLLTFADLYDIVQELARWLPTGSPPPIVVLALPSGPEFTAVQLAALATTAVVVPVAADITAHEAQRLAALFTPQLLVVASPATASVLLDAFPADVPVLGCATGGECRNPFVSWADVLSGRLAPCNTPGPDIDWPSATAILQLTSGSSGTPKGIALTRHNLAAYLDHQRPFLGRFSGEQVFCPVPQSHSYGGTVVLEHLFHGVGVHVARRFVPAADLRRMQRQRCTGLLAPPSYLRMLCQLGGLTAGLLPDLRWINLGTAEVNRELVAAVREARPDLTLFLRYGMTETMGYIAHLELAPGEDLEADGLVGTPIPGVDVAALPPLDEPPGEIRISGPTVAEAALVDGRPSPLRDADGRFSTGDLACRDAHGRLHLRGRISSFLKRNGFRINPFEIEAVLRAEPAVADAVVVGVADALAGQRLVAVVELDATVADPPTANRLLDACRGALSAYKVPQECQVVTALPRTRSGKPDRPRIRAMIDP